MSASLPPHLDPRGRRRAQGRARSRGNVARPIGRVVGAALSAGLLILAGYTWSTFRNIDRGVTRLQVSVGAKPTSAPQHYNAQDQNILLVGNDDRTNMTAAERKALRVGNETGSKATDTMMIVHIPANGSKATLISLPRDSYVDIPGFGKNKLNAAYVFGYDQLKQGASIDQRRSAGANLLIQTISNLTGLTINHYIQVSLLGFYEISNAIGGVPINLCANVDDTYAHNQQTGVGGGSGFKMTKGHHVIQGVQALEFVRQRHNFPGDREDLDRVRRQQYFLTAAFRQVASVGILFKLNALGDAVKRNIYLDPNLNLIDLAHQMENLSANNITGRTIPTTIGTSPDGLSILVVDPVKVRRFIDNLINPPAKPSTSATPSSSSASRSSTPASGSASSSAPDAIDAKCIY